MRALLYFRTLISGKIPKRGTTLRTSGWPRVKHKPACGKVLHCLTWQDFRSSNARFWGHITALKGAALNRAATELTTIKNPQCKTGKNERAMWERSISSVFVSAFHRAFIFFRFGAF